LMHHLASFLRINPDPQFLRRSANDLFALIPNHPDEGVIGIDIPRLFLGADRDCQRTGEECRRESFLRLPKAFLVLPLLRDIMGENQFGIASTHADRMASDLNQNDSSIPFPVPPQLGSAQPRYSLGY